MQINSEYIIVDKERGFQLMMVHLTQSPILSIDTESSGYYTYFPKVCLVQISAGNKNYIVDPLRLSDISGLSGVFKDPTKLKIFHSAFDDIQALKRDFGFEFQNIVDTMLSSRMLGIQQNSLNHLIEHFHQIKISKKEQKSNWEKRPLDRSQLQYAALDTAYLESIWSKLEPLLKEKKVWDEVVSEFEFISSMETPVESNHPISLQKFPGIVEMSAEQRRFVYDVLMYRDNKARRMNKAPFRVWNSQRVLEIVQAKGKPEKLQELLGKKDGEEIHKILEEPSGGPIGKAQLSPKITGDLEGEELERFKRLRSWRETAMSVRRLSHNMMPSNKILTDIAKRNPSEIQEIRELHVISDWKVQNYGPSMIAAMQSRPYESDLQKLIPVKSKFS